MPRPSTAEYRPGEPSYDVVQSKHFRLSEYELIKKYHFATTNHGAVNELASFEVMCVVQRIQLLAARERRWTVRAWMWVGRKLLRLWIAC